MHGDTGSRPAVPGDDGVPRSAVVVDGDDSSGTAGHGVEHGRVLAGRGLVVEDLHNAGIVLVEDVRCGEHAGTGADAPVAVDSYPHRDPPACHGAARTVSQVTGRVLGPRITVSVLKSISANGMASRKVGIRPGSAASTVVSSSQASC